MATDKEVNEITTLRNSGTRAGEIEIEIPEHEMLDRVLSGESFIVKNIFPADELRKMYLEVFRSYEGTQSRFQKYAWGMENFWRTDLNPAASKTKKIQAMYYILTWNNEFPKAAKIGGMLGRLRNRVGGLPLEYGFREEDEFWSIPLLHHYPAGGGYIGKHHDSLKPQNCVVSLTLGKEFREGGLFVELDGEDVLIEQMVDPGDLFIFRPDIPHGIAPIDPEETVNFRSPRGRWRMSTILISPAEKAA